VISGYLITTVSIIVTVVSSAATLAYWLGRKLTRIEYEVSTLRRMIKGLAEASVEAHSIAMEYPSLKGFLRGVKSII